MLTIEKLQMGIPPASDRNYVHPFYIDSIRCLFGAETVTDKPLMPTRNRVLLASLLNEVLGHDSQNVDFFFDIRLQEELGSPSPQYELLADLGLTSVLPICIHGTDLSIVKEGFYMAESMLINGRKALICVSNLASADWQPTEQEFASALLVSSDGINDNKIYMKGFVQNGKE
jgi:hypothetical protein